MLQNYDVDFYWSMRKDQTDMQHRSNAFKLINRFSRALFASKEGLALLLQQAYWYIETGVANIHFPRTYVLGNTMRILSIFCRTCFILRVS